jgi:glucose-6-phosphate-specific signal transduction histidine kinase
MGSIFSFIKDNFLNWQILTFVFIQSLMTFFLKNNYKSKLLLFIYSLAGLYYLAPCALTLWYHNKDIRFTMSLFLILLYSLYNSIVPFRYPKKKYSYFVFQWVANLFIFYLLYFFFKYIFCKGYSETQPDLPSFYYQKSLFF